MLDIVHLLYVQYVLCVHHFYPQYQFSCCYFLKLIMKLLNCSISSESNYIPYMCTHITIFITPHNKSITLLEVTTIVCEGCDKQVVLEIIVVKTLFL